MAQINKYQDQAAYTADTARSTAKSSVSLITSEMKVYHEGVNCIIAPETAQRGDLAVFDKIDGKMKIVAGKTLGYVSLPANLAPMAPVAFMNGSTPILLAPKIATFAGTESIRFAYPYEVKLTGFDLTNGGTFTLTINNVATAYTYPAASTMTSIAAVIASAMPNYNKTNYGGWVAVGYNDLGMVVLTSNTNSTPYSKSITATGCTLTKREVDTNYQTELTGVLIEGTLEYMRRRNGLDSYFAGCNFARFKIYYSVNGADTINNGLQSSSIIRESRFNSTDNPILAAAYATYDDYLNGEGMIMYPTTAQAMKRDGKANTAKIANLMFTDIFGNQQPRYPAAYAAARYGLSLDGFTTGLEAGAWWLTSVEELTRLMTTAPFTGAQAYDDLLNRTLRLYGWALITSQDNYWTPCEYSSSSAMAYNGTNGGIDVGNEYNAPWSRGLSAFPEL